MLVKAIGWLKQCAAVTKHIRDIAIAALAICQIFSGV